MNAVLDEPVTVEEQRAGHVVSARPDPLQTRRVRSQRPSDPADEHAGGADSGRIEPLLDPPHQVSGAGIGRSPRIDLLALPRWAVEDDGVMRHPADPPGAP